MDFAQYVNDRLQSKDVDPTAAFSVTVEGPLTRNGMMDVSATTVRSSGDPKMTEIVKTGIKAFDDAGYFQYFSALGSENLSIIISQDDKSVSGQFRLKMKTPERAKSVASGLSAIIQASKNIEQGPDDKLLIDNTSATVDGTIVTFSTVVPATSFHQLLLSRVSKNKGE